METLNIHEAKTHLSAILERCLAGEEFVIAKANRPIAKLVPLHPQMPRQLGMLKGQVPESFFEPLPKDLIDEWEK